MQLHVLQGGKPTGPFEEAEIISRWRKGILKDTDLVWTQGLDEWTPLAKLLSLSNSTQILLKNDESQSAKKTEPNSIKWYRRWQTLVAATATAFVLWLVLTAHPAHEQMKQTIPRPAREQMKQTSAPSSFEEVEEWIKQRFPTLATPQPTVLDERDIRAKQIMNYDKWRAEQKSPRLPTAVSSSHSAAWEKGYDVGRMHRANGEALPSLIKLNAMEKIEGDGFAEGYIKGFNGMDK